MEESLHKTVRRRDERDIDGVGCWRIQCPMSRILLKASFKITILYEGMEVICEATNEVKYWKVGFI